MASYTPPTENLPIFDNAVFEQQGDGLTLAKANLLYLRKTFADTATALETFTAGIATSSVDTETLGNILILGGTKATGGVNICNTTGITTIKGDILIDGKFQSNIKLLDNGYVDLASAGTNLYIGNTYAGNTNIGKTTGNVYLKGLTNFVNNLDSIGSTLNLGSSSYASTVNLGNNGSVTNTNITPDGAIQIGNGSSRTLGLQICNGNSNSSTLTIQSGQNNSGTINIGSSSVGTNTNFVNISNGTTSGSTIIGNPLNTTSIFSNILNIKSGIGTLLNPIGGSVNIANATGSPYVTTAVNISTEETNAAVTIGNSLNNVDINGTLRMGTGRNIVLQPTAGYIAPTSDTMLGAITAGSYTTPASSFSANKNVATVTVVKGSYMIFYSFQANYTSMPTTSFIDLTGTAATLPNLRWGASDIVAGAFSFAGSFAISVTTAGTIILRYNITGTINTLESYGYQAVRIA